MGKEAFDHQKALKKGNMEGTLYNHSNKGKMENGQKIPIWLYKKVSKNHGKHIQNI